MAQDTAHDSAHGAEDTGTNSPNWLMVIIVIVAVVTVVLAVVVSGEDEDDHLVPRDDRVEMEDREPRSPVQDEIDDPVVDTAPGAPDDGNPGD